MYEVVPPGNDVRGDFLRNKGHALEGTQNENCGFREELVEIFP